MNTWPAAADVVDYESGKDPLLGFGAATLMAPRTIVFYASHDQVQDG